MAKITELSQLDLGGYYSYADYLKWHFEEAVELIKGKILLMSPAPSLKHQSISRNLIIEFGNYFRNKPCRLFEAPFDVRLYDKIKSKKANQDIFTVVQPDLCVICDRSKLDENGCIGAPDLIIEILSKGNSKREVKTKFELYQECGVLEYWIVYPYEETVHQFYLNEATERYELKAMFADDDLATPILFPDLKVDLRDIFAD